MNLNEESGFTLIELLITVTIIGLLASIAIPAYGDYKKMVRFTAAYEELRGLRTSFIAYTVDNEDLPTDVGQGVIPGGMEKYIPADQFANETPIGGRYNWDGPPNHDPPGISIQGPDFTPAEMLSLDSRIDDGNFATGEFRRTHDGHYKLIVRN